MQSVERDQERDREKETYLVNPEIERMEKKNSRENGEDEERRLCPRESLLSGKSIISTLIPASGRASTIL